MEHILPSIEHLLTLLLNPQTCMEYDSSGRWGLPCSITRGRMVLWKQKISVYTHYSWIAIPIEIEIQIAWRQIEGMCVSSSEKQKQQSNTYKTFIKTFISCKTCMEHILPSIEHLLTLLLNQQMHMEYASLGRWGLPHLIARGRIVLWKQKICILVELPYPMK